MSDSAKSLREAHRSEVPDPERVERLREAIASGEFTADLHRIAGAMLEEER